ncbi:MAG: hypothetical protein AB7U95_39435 [Reyranella sp.]
MPSKRETDEQYDRIISCLREHGELTRDAIHKYTTLPINVTTPRVRELLDAGRLVETVSVRNPDSGRMARLVTLPHGPAVIDPQQAFALEETL